MVSPVRTYQDEMHQNLGFFATWLPGDPIEVGDVGTLVDGRFRRASSLKELRVACVESDPGAAQSIEYTSTKGTKIGAAIGANAGGFMNAQIEINFSAEGAFVFHATGLRARRLQNLSEVSDAILVHYREGTWRKEWMLVEACHEATHATIIVSQDDLAAIVLSAKADSLIPAISLANPKLKLAVSSSRGKLLHFVGKRSMRPLYSCLSIQDRIFSEPSVAPARGTAGGIMAFRRPDIRELLDS